MNDTNGSAFQSIPAENFFLRFPVNGSLNKFIALMQR